ncbi:hypothetical protein BD626DRAFT_625591 [Schizophyllum amplum]|uniref:MYND-type domain-containing protein n=1 Tax=Schizophyllum amplum TaxID=97359 RepID=A0A550D033_9AGAR|nr:hypothetical protein BD626DRAFT_625591 [Auriculariopsis ampla]
MNAPTPLVTAFRSAFPDTVDRITHDMLTPALSRRLFACLKHTRIPSHPFDQAAVDTIAEVLYALGVYFRISHGLDDNPAAFKGMVLSHFPDVWQWFVFLCPQSGHITDLPPTQRRESGCDLLPDGDIYISLAWRLSLIVATIPRLLKTAEGARALLSISDLVPVVISLLVYDSYPTSVAASIAIWQHRLCAVLFQLLNHRMDALKRRAHDEMAAFEGQNRGVIAWTLIHRLALFFHPDNEDAFLPYYYYFFRIDTMKDTIDRLHTLNPVQSIVNMLAWATTSSIWPASLTAGQHRIITIWMGVLGPLLDLPNSIFLPHTELLIALRAGILPIVHRLLELQIPSGQLPAATEEDMMYKLAAVDMLKTIFLPGLVWRDVLRTIRSATKDTDILTNVDSAKDPDWNAFAAYYRYFCAIWSHYKEALVEARKSCAYTECQRSSNLKMCICGSVCYCSIYCQRLHWRPFHQPFCVPRAPIRKSRQPGSPAWNTVTHSERLFFQCCALEVIRGSGDPDALQDYCSVMVDFVNEQMTVPAGVRIQYGAMEELAFAFQPKDRDARAVHIGVRVSSVTQIIQMEVDVLSYKTWRDVAGCGKRASR